MELPHIALRKNCWIVEGRLRWRIRLAARFPLAALKSRFR
jgi:hypothetical protein